MLSYLRLLTVFEPDAAPQLLRPDPRLAHLTQPVHLFVSRPAVPDRQSLLHPPLPPGGATGSPGAWKYR